MIPSRAGGFEAGSSGGLRLLVNAAFVTTEGGRYGLSARLLALDGRIAETTAWPFGLVGTLFALLIGAFWALLKTSELGDATTLAGTLT